MIRVKICGITNLEDACAAAEAGADLLGFVFYPPSPRYVAPETAQGIVAYLRDRYPAVTSVGVFVNESDETVKHVLDLANLDLAQLHGEEPREAVEALAGRAFKGLRPQYLAELSEQLAYYAAPSQGGEVRRTSSLAANPIAAPEVLVDAYHPRLYGGTGETCDWPMLAPVARQHRLLLAGGLTPGNVAEAIAVVRPWGVDVSSGVEADKGRKDHPAVRRFILRAKGAHL